MIHQIILCRLQPGTAPGQVDDLMRQTRSRLLKIPEFRSVICGKPVDPENGWNLVIAADFENLTKMRLGHRSPIYARFDHEVLTPHVVERQVLTYELEPGKELKYS